jgi:hypothetical protein
MRLSQPLCVFAAILPTLSIGSELPQSLIACTKLQSDSKRLACFDREIGSLVEGHPQPPHEIGEHPASAPDAAPIETQARFGDDGRLRSETKPTVPKSLTATVREIMPLPAGLYRLTLDNGQVWSTTQADSALAFKVDDAVTISRLLLGGYEISLKAHTTSVSIVRIK